MSSELPTDYKDKYGNLLLHTFDGSNNTVTVSDMDKGAFCDATTSTIGDVVNSKDWNERMKGYLSSGWLLGSTYNSLGKESAKDAFVDWMNAPTASNWFAGILAAVGSRWTTPEIVAGNLSAGVAAYGSKIIAFAAETVPQYTKSSLKLGQEMHKTYKLGANGIKEFRLPSGKRIDFPDINNSTIFELKPFNPRAMKARQNQLNMYIQELQTMPQFKGVPWKTILDTY